MPGAERKCVVCGGRLPAGGGWSLHRACAEALMAETQTLTCEPTVAGYELVARLGEGGMAVVWLAERGSTGAEVALKVFRHDPDAEPDLAAKFRREVELLNRAGRHAHVVSLIDSGATADGRPWFAMQYVPGRTLDAAFAHKRSALPPRDAGLWLAGILGQVADAVGHCHAACKIAHCDLTPANILVDDEGRTAFVTDFGLAEPLNEVATPGQGGTAGFRPPEQRDGSGPPAAAWDIHNIGAILYFLLTDEARAEAAPRPIRELNPAADRDLEAIAHRSLRAEPAARYATMAEVAAELRRCVRNVPARTRLRDVPPEARRARPPERVRRWAARNRLAVFGVGVTALIAAAVWCWQYVRTLNERAGAAERDRLTQLRQAARASAAGGDWMAALSNLDKLIAEEPGPGRRNHWRVERLRGLFAVSDRAELDRSLSELEADLDGLSPRHRGLVLLMRGDFHQSDTAGLERARVLITAAMAHAADLPEADRLYAEGLLAETAPAALGKFRAACRVDRFHHRANGALLTTLLVCGHYDEARRQAGFMRSVFRRDPLPHLIGATIDLIHGDARRGRERLNHLRAALGAERTERLISLFDAIGELHADFTAALKFNDRWSLSSGFRFFRAFLKVRSRSMPELGGIGLHVAPVAFCYRSAMPFLVSSFRISPLFLPLQTAEAMSNLADSLESAAEVRPECVAFTAAAAARAVASSKFLKRGMRSEHDRQFLSAAGLFDKAIRAPSILPDNPCRYFSAWMAALMTNELIFQAGKRDAVTLRRYEFYVRRTIELGDEFPEYRPGLLGSLGEHVVKGDFGGRPPTRHDCDLLRRVFTAWHRHDSTAHEPIRFLAFVEHHAGHPRVALEWARALEFMDVPAARRRQLDRLRDALRRRIDEAPARRAARAFAAGAGLAWVVN